MKRNKKLRESLSVRLKVGRVAVLTRTDTSLTSPSAENLMANDLNAPRKLPCSGTKSGEAI